MSTQTSLFSNWRSTLDASHYLSAKGSRARMVYEDAHGVIVFSSPSSRRLPNDWLELSRWCIAPGGRGSEQWKAARKWLMALSDASTVVSYSDPSVGHTGALYRACNWIWAPTWHVLRPPPTGAGIRGGKRQHAKHRWVALLTKDARREEALRLRDSSLEARFPWASYTEPRWRHDRPILSGQDRFKRFQQVSA